MSLIDEHGRARLSLVRSPSFAMTQRSPESVQAGKLWDALFTARNGQSARNLADLEDAVFRFYLPMARTLAHELASGPKGFTAAERAAELGLAQAVLAWRHRDSSDFRRFATSSIQVQLNRLQFVR
jgi:hypothetical protein